MQLQSNNSKAGKLTILMRLEVGDEWDWFMAQYRRQQEDQIKLNEMKTLKFIKFPMASNNRKFKKFAIPSSQEESEYSKSVDLLDNSEFSNDADSDILSLTSSVIETSLVEFEIMSISIFDIQDTSNLNEFFSIFSTFQKPKQSNHAVFVKIECGRLSKLTSSVEQQLLNNDSDKHQFDDINFNKKKEMHFKDLNWRMTMPSHRLNLVCIVYQSALEGSAQKHIIGRFSVSAMDISLVPHDEHGKFLVSSRLPYPFSHWILDLYCSYQDH